MKLLPKPVRRALLPVSVAVVIGFAALFAAGLLVGVLTLPLDRRGRLARTCAFGLSYCAMELAALIASGATWVARPLLRARRDPRGERWMDLQARTLAWAVGVVLRAARRCFGFEVVIDGHSMPGPLDGPAAVLVLARHAGPGDSFALAHLLMTRHRKRVRIVLKDVLQLDPAIDVLLNRLGSCFLRQGAAAGDESAGRVAELVRAARPGDAVLLFPEGGNWTPRRRSRAIRHLRRVDENEAARAAELMEHVLPARPAGILASLDARPEVPVVIAAHAGLDKIVSLAEAWRAIPVREPMTVRLWPASPAPRGEDERLAWLRREWALVDEWVDAQHAAGDAPP